MDSKTEQLPHALTMKERTHLTLSGVTEVVSFDEYAVVMMTSAGPLIVQGEQLKLKNLTLDGGQVAIDGQISSLIYDDANRGGRRRLRR